MPRKYEHRDGRPNLSIAARAAGVSRQYMWGQIKMAEGKCRTCGRRKALPCGRCRKCLASEKGRI